MNGAHPPKLGCPRDLSQSQWQQQEAGSASGNKGFKREHITLFS